MEKHELNIKYSKLYFNDLNDADKKIIDSAVEAAKRAYAPYSKFRVGAAVLLSDGKIVEGNNQENAAYPSGLCAERVALFYANASYPNSSVNTIAILAIDNEGNILEQNASPCGACRQVIAESEMRSEQKIRILLASRNYILEFHSIKDLLPFSFGKDNLE